MSCVNKLAGSSCAAAGSLAGRPVALASLGEVLGLPVVHIAYPLPAGLSRWADPRVAGIVAVAQGVHVRPTLVDPCVYLISSADGPVTRDEDIDVALWGAKLRSCSSSVLVNETAEQVTAAYPA